MSSDAAVTEQAPGPATGQTSGQADGQAAGQGTTYVLVDGENIDATLGTAILQARPAPDQRPRWERVLTFAQQRWGQDVKGLFFLNATSGSLPMSFVQALLAIGFQPIPLAGESHEKVVDIGIKRTLEAIAGRPGDVMLVSHDGDFAAELGALVADGDRRTGLIAFREFTSTQLSGLISQGLQTFDLEHDVQAFNVQLPRVRIIPLEQFDPMRYL